MNDSTKTKPLRTLITCSLLVALEVILGRWFAIRTPLVNISFAFVPLSMVGMLFGPFWGFAAGGLADFIGAVLFPQGPYFPGFTLTNALCGMVHGFLLHKSFNVIWNRVQTLVHIGLSVAIVNLVLQMGLNTYWLIVIGATSKGYWVLLSTRLIKYLIMIPVQIAVIYIIQNSLVDPILKKRLLHQPAHC